MTANKYTEALFINKGMFIIYVGGGGSQIRGGGGAKSFTPSQGGVMKVLRVVRGGGS